MKTLVIFSMVMGWVCSSIGLAAGGMFNAGTILAGVIVCIIAICIMLWPAEDRA